MLIANGVAFAVLPIMVLLSERVSTDYLVIGSFGIRMSAALSFTMMDTPFSKLFRFVVVVLINSTYCEHLISDTLLAKKMPGDIRGVIKGSVHSFAMFIGFCFHIAAAKLVGSGFSARAPLIIVAGLDAFVVFFTLFSSLTELSSEFSMTPKRLNMNTDRNKVRDIERKAPKVSL